jgi:hypothetical protein
MTTMQEHFAGWQRAFIRFEASDIHHGSTGSYQTGQGVKLFDVFKHDAMFKQLNELGTQLRNVLPPDKRRFCLFLLTVNSDFSYHIDFEHEDTARWAITKMNGATGIPVRLIRLETRLQRHVVMWIFLLALVACTDQDLMQKLATPADQSLARHYFDLLRQHQYDEIERSMDPILSDPSLHNTLVMMAASIPPGEPTTVTLVGVGKNDGTHSSKLNLAFEYNFSGKWLLMNVEVKRRPEGTMTITGFHVHPQPSSLEEQGKYVPGRTTAQYVELGLVILLPALALCGLGVRIRNNMKGRAAGGDREKLTK